MICNGCNIFIPSSTYMLYDDNQNLMPYCHECYSKMCLDNWDTEGGSTSSRDHNGCECGNKSSPKGQGHSHWCPYFKKEF